MLNCPHCNQPVDLKALKHQSMFRNYRVCPGCEGRFTVDRATKRRQAIMLVFLFVVLGLTLLLYYDGNQWLLPALVSYTVFGGLLYHGNRLVQLVPYEE